MLDLGQHRVFLETCWETLEDADYDVRKRFKANEALLATYQQEIAALRSENQQLAAFEAHVTDWELARSFERM